MFYFNKKKERYGYLILFKAASEDKVLEKIIFGSTIIEAIEKSAIPEDNIIEAYGLSPMIDRK